MGRFTSGNKTIIPALCLCQDCEESSAAEKKRAHNSSSANAHIFSASERSAVKSGNAELDFVEAEMKRKTRLLDQNQRLSRR